jgi:uncharacterized protein
VRFEWDKRKNYTNFRKHGIWFEEAQTVWEDALSEEFYDHIHSHLEERFLRVGVSTAGRLLVVVFVPKGCGLTTRLISARKASPAERERHEKRIRLFQT